MKKLYLGVMGLGSDSWHKTFYPPKTKPAERITYYATQFNAIEMDSTLYSVPSESTIDTWREAAPEDFAFTAKVHSNIIRAGAKLLEKTDEFVAFADRMKGLGKNLKCLLFQFPPNFSFANNFQNLARFMEAIPHDVRYAIEIRKPDRLNDEYFSFLKERKIAHVLQEYPKMPRDVIITTDFTYIRIMGDRKGYIERYGEVYTDIKEEHTEDLEYWAKTVHGLKVPAYMFIAKHFEGHSPKSAWRFKEILEKVGGK